MRWVAILILAACTEGSQPPLPPPPPPIPPPDLSGPYVCGKSTCSSGQVCLTESAGSQCWVNPDAGIGPYDEVSATCVDLPATCNGYPTCDCVGGQGICLGASGRDVNYGCI